MRAGHETTGRYTDSDEYHDRGTDTDVGGHGSWLDR